MQTKPPTHKRQRQDAFEITTCTMLAAVPASVLDLPARDLGGHMQQHCPLVRQEGRGAGAGEEG